MGRLFELPFSVATEELAKTKENGSILLPRIYSTVVAGLSLHWQLKIFPHGLSYSNAKQKSEKFNVSLTLLTPAELKANDKFETHIALQIADKDGHFPAIKRLAGSLEWGIGGWCQWCLTVDVKPDLSPGKRVVGRILVCVDPAAVSPAALSQAKVEAVKTVDYGPIATRLYEEGIAGNAVFCDTLIQCRDGSLRACSSLLFVQSEFFLSLFDFKGNAGAGSVERNVDFKEYTVATVAAMMKLLHTFALPPLDAFSVADLNLLLHLGNQIAPMGLELLKASVELSLIGRTAVDVEELGHMANLAETHGLSLLANRTLVGLAAQPIRHYKQLQKIVQEKIWESVENLCDNRMESIYFFVPAAAPKPKQ